MGHDYGLNHGKKEYRRGVYENRHRKEEKDMYDYLVVGSGLYGAVFAYEAKAHGNNNLQK